MTRENSACNVRNKYLLDVYDMAHLWGHGVPILFDDWWPRFPGCPSRMRPGSDPRVSAQRKWERLKAWLISNYPACVVKRSVRTSSCSGQEHEAVALVFLCGAQAAFEADLPEIEAVDERDESGESDEIEECAA